MEHIIAQIAKIYPEAADTVLKNMPDGGVKAGLYFPEPGNNGAFCLVETGQWVTAYLSFERDLDDPTLRAILYNELEPYMTGELPPSSLFFNIYGPNRKAIEWAHELGFKLEMEGVRMAYRGDSPPAPEMADLQERGFGKHDFEAIISLFDEAYRQLNLDNGWKPDWHSRNHFGFLQDLDFANQRDSFRSFWQGKRLVGAYILRDLYLSDLAVQPDLQGRGYGTRILQHAIRKMLLDHSKPEVRLNVACTNTGAIRLYRKNGFEEIGLFADHVYGGK
jgi:GNAT superfamily N-acetyltransferase